MRAQVGDAAVGGGVEAQVRPDALAHDHGEVLRAAPAKAAEGEALTARGCNRTVACTTARQTAA